MTDLFRQCELARAAGSLVAVDNSLMSPYLQRPLSCGADLVIHAATKFLNGRSDVTAGVIVTENGELAERIGFYQNATGTALAPFDGWLLERGMKTLPLRLDKQQSNAGLLARYLRSHPVVERVHYVGLPGLQDETCTRRRGRTDGGFVDRCRIPYIAPSLDGVESLIEMPVLMSYWDQTPEARRRFGITDSLVRFSCGIEDTVDLIDDLEQALRAV